MHLLVALFLVLQLGAFAFSPVSLLRGVQGRRGTGDHFERRAVSSLFGEPRTMQIEVADAIYEIDVEPNQTVLDAAEENEIEIPYDCRLGTCLRCTVKVEEGKVDQGDGTLDQSLVDQGYALACQCTLLSDNVLIKVVPEDEVIDQQFSEMSK
uniref:2Fe-2S ferredoxin-type domain-containing protein n=1 Tax=Chromera velia CCMP2878 TaxID=1169474 RepID=A0A0G4HIS4_9ALVE|mmetsp:Transcript_10258/g.19894  ORF Transcript_10258/g.19894 Transcript_10258/m.19894 type:complete len:153 (-) Transcript_10258:225-683(-)|eukprot:Cvel_1093.t1-p1 / transcript=Cvel_1093.t1 / gene=Cvel_1093 / organism=Chromera_velia_CCMP2878 / gene_product=Ferredoxin, root R-B1, putative / transcript_product=Ferredoxin, root R-B1, putative / location=Cvel_scaffold35:116909-117364(+) / protein_length=152 / sequence_SO=supercontig / SO=protein_coding / is_pseudo=false